MSFSGKNKPAKAAILIDRILWMILWLLPFFAWRYQIEAVVTTAPLLEFVDTNYAWPWVRDILDEVANLAFGSTFPLAGYVSYVVMVEIVHVLFDVIVFIPRFAHKLMEKAVSL